MTSFFLSLIILLSINVEQVRANEVWREKVRRVRYALTYKYRPTGAGNGQHCNDG
jgi:hypothetical protein